MSIDTVWVRGVTGMQLHHTTDLQDATRFLSNGAMAMRAAHVRTGDKRYPDLVTKLQEVQAHARALEGEARARLQRLHAADPQRFVRCREGEEPWPDEIAPGFIPRHTCQDRCLYYDHGVLEAIIQCLCNRPPCRACAIAGR